MNLQALRYPIGEFDLPKQITHSHIEEWIGVIESFPVTLRKLTHQLSVEELNWQYRPEGWSIKQVVHHCGDSHLNSLMRFKLALTEDQPMIKPYLEDRWALLADSLDDQLEPSLKLLEGLHYRWVVLLRSLTSDQLDRTFVHPEHGTTFTLKQTIGNYAWHCNHHQAHIEQAITYHGDFSSLYEV